MLLFIQEFRQDIIWRMCYNKEYVEIPLETTKTQRFTFLAYSISCLLQCRQKESSVKTSVLRSIL